MIIPLIIEDTLGEITRGGIECTVLACRSGVERVPFVVPTAHRDRPEMTRVIGCFVTMLPLVIDLSDRPTVCDALTRVRLLIADAFLDGPRASAYGKRYYVLEGRNLRLIQTVVDRAFTERIRKMEADSDKKQR